jgi:hypothetical protein
MLPWLFASVRGFSFPGQLFANAANGGLAVPCIPVSWCALLLMLD